MSGGKRIDDHKFFGGGHSKASVFPEGVHTKEYHSEGASGDVTHFEDTTEQIAAAQKLGHKKQKGHDRVEYHRY